jgi:16S rRNA (guanine527-N7)-methyltransferase
MRRALSLEDLGRELGVSRETLGRFEAFGALLKRWQEKVNLVGPGTIGDMWRAHFLDSAQLWPLAPKGARKWLDLGSGAGFPGLVLAIMGAPEVHLVESNQKKAAFLREAARITAAPVVVHSRRIENLPPFPVDVITARALAKLDVLLQWACPFAHAETVALFLKGQDVDVELTETSKSWIIDVNRYESRSDSRGVILRIRSLGNARKHPN